MSTKHLTLKELGRTLRNDARTLKRHVTDAVRKTAQLGVGPVRDNAPEAFSELKDSVHAGRRRDGGGRFLGGTAAIIVDAPHAAAVEVGSRPHLPPIAPLVEWVKLRGTQGLDGYDAPSAGGHPRAIAAELGTMSRGGSTPIDAPTQIAWRIARAIAKNGTKPTWFVAKSLPEVERILDAQVKTWLSKPLP